MGEGLARVDRLVSFGIGSRADDLEELILPSLGTR
jgi:hypothetical protein